MERVMKCRREEAQAAHIKVWILRVRLPRLNVRRTTQSLQQSHALLPTSSKTARTSTMSALRRTGLQQTGTDRLHTKTLDSAV